MLALTMGGIAAVGAVLCHALYEMIENDWMDHDE